MKVLVSTDDTQGKRTNDFSWVPVGELVMFGFECDGESIDDYCGCKRAMIGIVSRKATTTMKVVDMRRMTRGQLFDRFERSEMKAGFNPDPAIIINMITYICQAIEAFPVGSIIERRGDTLLRRT
jgi:hypothetical protein